MTFEDAKNKIDKIIIEIENDGFEISLIAELITHEKGVRGSQEISHNGEYLRSEIIVNHEEEKMWNES